MAAATNTQVQRWSDERTRVRAEQARTLVHALEGDTGDVFESVFLNLNGSPDWEDDRTDGPPNLMTPGDLLAVNSFCADVLAYIKAHGSYPNILKACVRPVGG